MLVWVKLSNDVINCCTGFYDQFRYCLGLILVMEPYFNEAGYEKQKGSQQGKENSRMYNEMVLLKLVQSMTKIALHPPPVFQTEIQDHLRHHAYK